ncbi:MAG: FHA domain-containing protein [Gemmataceae bacterium]|nr:FHA domain-containing protein [Gemmataceae bacterium]
MVKCPFCQYDNEEGALFCEQCKSDLAMVAPTPAPLPPQPVPGPASPPPAFTEPVPMAALMPEETIPLAAIEEPPMAVMPLEPTIPLAGVIESSAEPLTPIAPPASAEPVPIPMPLPPVAPAPTPAAPPAPPAREPAAVVPVPPSLSLAPEIPPAPAAAPPPVLTPAPAPAPAEGGKLPEGAQPRLVVIRGQKIKQEFPLYDGHNFIGRADEKPVDIDLEDQEPPDRIWTSRQHALITLEEGLLTIEDLNSANGTFVNRTRVYPGQKRTLGANDVIQIGTVQMRVTV